MRRGGDERQSDRERGERKREDMKKRGKSMHEHVLKQIHFFVELHTVLPSISIDNGILKRCSLVAFADISDYLKGSHVLMVLESPFDDLMEPSWTWNGFLDWG